MADMFWNFKPLATLAIVILVTFSQSNADFREFMTYFMARKTVATSYLKIECHSSIRCVELCYEERKRGLCNIAAFNKATKSCLLSTDTQQDVVDFSDDSSSVFIFQHKPSAVTQGTLHTTYGILF